MKKYIYTTAGKTMLFIGNMISMGSLLLSGMACAVLTVLGFYMGSENDVWADYSSNNLDLSAEQESIVEFHRNLIHTGYAMRYWAIALFVISLILSVMLFVALMSAAARRDGKSEDIYPGPFNKLPIDLLFSAGVSVVVFFALIISETYNLRELIVVAATAGIVSIAIFLGLSMSTAARIKQRNLLKNTVVFRCLVLIRDVLLRLRDCIISLRDICLVGLSRLPLIWKTTLVVVIVCIIEFMSIVACNFDVESLLAIWFIGRIIIVPFIFWIVWMLRKLQNGAELMAEGNLDCHIATTRMFGDIKRSAENLNNIAGGMALAVDERMKSERLKTELITNVSHDIKTPLTSVINYASLIGEEIETLKKDELRSKGRTDADEEHIEKMGEYCDVLLRQSNKLKTLIDDLVEASKAQTGNIDVYLAPCKAATFITQTAGEYEERLKKSKLTFVTKCSEDITIMADSRRMQRIFDNLMNNICKYAQPDTRVYLSLERDKDNAVFVFKNISKAELDISEEELMERFVRGDRARNTDGNGLGLSIARSLAELQGGNLNLSTDGDLFKVVLRFPCREQY